MKLLSIDCEAFYDADFLGRTKAKSLFDEIISSFDVTNKTVKMADGSEQITELGTYLFADAELTSFEAFPKVWGKRSAWPQTLANVRDCIERKTGVRFQVARCVYYQSGSKSMGFHRDLPAYGDTSAIASLSLGAEREFIFRKTTNPNESFAIPLASGSLLFMGKGCQENYEHALIADPQCNQPRLNLTFRKYGWG
ncbi:alpha-ketoglutarate-dependent dioxygenase AlkB [Leptothoe sp. EHU-05/26/07-4]